jgi:uncharacterized protein (DUF849 family)
MRSIVRCRHVSRSGFEDTLELPDNELPADNAALVVDQSIKVL